MKVKELDNIINEVLLDEAKKLIEEQITQIDHLLDAVKNFQTLSGLSNKITDLEDAGTDKMAIHIKIENLKPEELVDCCGGTSLGEAIKNMMQGLHHDLEDNGFGNNFDVDIDTQGDENDLNLIIRIIGNNDELSGEKNMKENTKDTNPIVTDKKNMILGGKISNEESKKAVEEKEVTEEDLDEVKKWIQKAVDPKHKGYCTPMTKKTCTPRRKALAKRFKKGIEKESVQSKKILSLSEAQMIELLRKIINEAAETMDKTTEAAIRNSGKENADYLAAVEKKIKDYLSFKGNDNPKFPHQIGQGEEKSAYKNTKDQEETIADERGRNPLDLDYDNDKVDDNSEPNKKFKDRMEKAILGHSTMGNPPDAANAIKGPADAAMLKSKDRKLDKLRKEPIYAKEPVPVKTKTEKEPIRPVNEEKEEKKVEVKTETKSEEKPEKKINPIVEEEIKKMKRMASYNEKTQ